MVKFAALILALSFGQNANAEGTLAFNLQNQFGFQKLSLSEISGVRNGNLIVGMGSAPAVSYVKNNQLVMQLGNKVDTLSIQKAGEATAYRGVLKGSKVTDIQVWSRGLRGFILKGMIGEMSFMADVDSMTKEFYMKWKNNELILWGGIHPFKQNGSCKGVLQTTSDDGTQSEEAGRFTCQSSGSLKDTLFKNPHDVIATIVHIFVVPGD